MIRRVIETTDGKYVGLWFDDTKPFISPDGITFHPDKMQDLGGGLMRYSNSNYVVLTKEVRDGKDK